MMKRFAYTKFILGVTGALGLSGCIEVGQEVVLNPDGSGKVVMTSAIAMPDLGGISGLKDAGAKVDPKAQAREFAVAMLRSEGIEAWSDVKYEIGKDGKTRATATGYFPDVTKVRLNNQMGDKEEKQSLGITKNADGNWVLKLDPKKEKKDEAKKDDASKAAEATPDADEKKKPLTDDELDEKLVQERQQWAAMKGFMGALFEGMKMRSSLEGGGTIVSAAVYKKESESKATFEFNGKQLLEMVDKLLQDDEKAKKMLREGKSPTSNEGGPDEMFAAVFGEGTPTVVMKPGAAAFDYSAAVAKAKASQTPELKALIADAKKPPKKSEFNFNIGPGSGNDEQKSDDAGQKKPTRTKPRKID
jgi:hypothetical protein